MSKVYILTDTDLEHLRSKLIFSAYHNSRVSEERRTMVEEIFRHFNYHVETWISEVKK